MRLFYYVGNYAYNALPSVFFRQKYRALKRYKAKCNLETLQERLDYYCKLDRPVPIPTQAVAVKDFKNTQSTSYYLDLKEFLHYFSKDTKFAYQFGDDTHINPYPTLFKARPVGTHNAHSVLFKLNKHRHFHWIKDPIPYLQKKDILVWRGGAYHPLRRNFVAKYWNKPGFDVGQTNRPAENNPMQKEHLSIKEQLQYKFIACPEGNDVATNLKWAMSSNCLCFMPKPTCETWFMEGKLLAGVHYVQTQSDFEDLPEKMQHYLDHPLEAQAIIQQANQHVANFQDQQVEELLCIMVLEKYARATGQTDCLRFE